MKNRGADVVSQPGRGGISKPVMKFQGFNSVKGGGLVEVAPHDAKNPAPRQKEVPLAIMSGQSIGMDLPPLPVALTGDVERAPVALLPSSSPIVPVSVAAALQGSSGTTAAIQPKPRATKIVTFIGEFSETDFACHEILQDPDLGWLSLVMPIETTCRVKPEQTLVMRIGAVERPYWFTGIQIPLPEFGICTRVFAEVKASQEEAGSV